MGRTGMSMLQNAEPKDDHRKGVPLGTQGDLHRHAQTRAATDAIACWDY